MFMGWGLEGVRQKRRRGSRVGGEGSRMGVVRIGSGDAARTFEVCSLICYERVQKNGKMRSTRRGVRQDERDICALSLFRVEQPVIASP